MGLGEIIQQLRKEKGLTQEQLAQDLNISKSALIKYENNIRVPNFEAMAKLEKYFKVSASYLKGESQYRKVSEQDFYNEVLHIDETLKDKPEEIKKATISIYNSFKEIVDKTIEREDDENLKEQYLEEAMKRLSILRSLIDKINTIYFSTYLPTKDLWSQGKLTELEFFKKKEEIFKKHLSAVEYYLSEAFYIRCNELYLEYSATFDTIDQSKIDTIDETSQEIAADITYTYPEYFKNGHGSYLHDRSGPCYTKEAEMVYLPLLGETAAGKAIEVNELLQGYVPVRIDKARNKTYLVRIKGDSMINADIHDGDLAIIRPQPAVEDGEIALVNINGDSTIKYVFKKEDQIELRPANPAYNPMIYPINELISIKGKLIGVIKKAEAEELMKNLED